MGVCWSVRVGTSTTSTSTSGRPPRPAQADGGGIGPRLEGEEAAARTTALRIRNSSQGQATTISVLIHIAVGRHRFVLAFAVMLQKLPAIAFAWLFVSSLFWGRFLVSELTGTCPPHPRPPMHKCGASRFRKLQTSHEGRMGGQDQRE